MRRAQLIVLIIVFTLFAQAHKTIGIELSKIVFAATTVFLGKYQIHVMNADGTNITRLTDTEADNNSPVFSPDGSRIAFVSSRDGKSQIYIMNADGTNQTRLSDATVEDWAPAFNPDGTKIVFASSRRGAAEIYVMNTDGTGVVRLTNLTDLTKRLPGDLEPRFSPDGRKIAFVSKARDCAGVLDPNCGGIYLMNADGTRIMRLIHLTFDEGPRFSPDGGKSIHICGYRPQSLGFRLSDFRYEHQWFRQGSTHARWDER